MILNSYAKMKFDIKMRSYQKKTCVKCVNVGQQAVFTMPALELNQQKCIVAQKHVPTVDIHRIPSKRRLV